VSAKNGHVDKGSFLRTTGGLLPQRWRRMASLCLRVWKIYIAKPICTRMVPQFTTEVAEPLTIE
jgi:hypothetical protein